MIPDSKIYYLLNRLGVTENYVGYFYLSSALQLCVEDRERLQFVTKAVYIEVADQLGTTWKAVERGIRSAGLMIWEENPFLLEQLAGRKLSQRPCSSQMLAILSSWLSVKSDAVSQ